MTAVDRSIRMCPKWIPNGNSGKGFFTPYAETLADLVDECVRGVGRAVLIDLHSCPVRELPYEGHRDAKPPGVLGVDVDDTPGALQDRVSRAFYVISQVRVSQPFAGSSIPLRHFGRDNRVTSVMAELPREMYLRDDGAWTRKVPAVLALP